MTNALAQRVALPAILLIAVSFTACTAAVAPPATRTSAATSTADPAAVSEYNAAVANYSRELPDGYVFPSDLQGSTTADKWWWCANIESAWHAYFLRDDEDAAVDFLRKAEAVDPGEYAGFEGTDNEIRIDRHVRFIDGGVDSEYVELTSTACNKWARSLGVELDPAS